MLLRRGNASSNIAADHVSVRQTDSYDADGAVRDGAMVAELTSLLDLTDGHRECTSSPARSTRTRAANSRSPA